MVEAFSVLRFADLCICHVDLIASDILHWTSSEPAAFTEIVVSVPVGEVCLLNGRNAGRLRQSGRLSGLMSAFERTLK